MDNPTYGDVQCYDLSIRQLWGDTIIKVLNSLRGLSSFEMVVRLRGTNIIQLNWALNRKRYPDPMMKHYKARFRVRGDQKIEGIDVFETSDFVTR